MEIGCHGFGVVVPFVLADGRSLIEDFTAENAEDAEKLKCFLTGFTGFKMD